MVSTCMTKLATQVEMIKKSFVCTGIIQRGLLSHDDLNYRLKQYIVDDEDWDRENELLKEISEFQDDYSDDDEIIDGLDGLTFYSL